MTKPGSKSEDWLSMEAFSLASDPVSHLSSLLKYILGTACFYSPEKMWGLCIKDSCFNQIITTAKNKSNFSNSLFFVKYFFILEKWVTPKPFLKGAVPTSFERPWAKRSCSTALVKPTKKVEVRYLVLAVSRKLCQINKNTYCSFKQHFTSFKPHFSFFLSFFLIFHYFWVVACVSHRFHYFILLFHASIISGNNVEIILNEFSSWNPDQFKWKFNCRHSI